MTTDLNRRRSNFLPPVEAARNFQRLKLTRRLSPAAKGLAVNFKPS